MQLSVSLTVNNQHMPILSLGHYASVYQVWSPVC